MYDFESVKDDLEKEYKLEIPHLSTSTIKPYSWYKKSSCILYGRINKTSDYVFFICDVLGNNLTILGIVGIYELDGLHTKECESQLNWCKQQFKQ
jgi:hypothetical protein